MSGGHHIAAVRAEPFDTAFDEADMPALPGPLGAEDWESGAVNSHPLWRDRTATALAWVAALGWLAVAAWFTYGSWATLAPAAAIELAAAVAVPPVLIGVLYLLAMRGGRVEGDRLARTAAAMRGEAASLQDSADAIAATLDANRLALSEQWSRLAALSEAATERLRTIGGAMTDEVARAEGHAARVSRAAADSSAEVQALLAALPRARDETAALGGLIDAAGHAAADRVAALEQQMLALAERGHDAEAVASGAAAALADHLDRMDATGTAAAERLGATTAELAATVDTLLDRAAGAIDDAHHGIAAQGDAMLAMVSAHQASLDEGARRSVEALAERVAAVDAAVAALAARLAEQRDAGAALIDGLAGGVADVDARLDALHRQGAERSQLLAASISALGGSADAMTESLKAGEAMATRTIGSTESLLTALDAAAREIDETLPEALGRLDARVSDTRAVIAAARPELLGLVTAAEGTHDAIEAVAAVIADQRRTLDQLSAALLETLSAGRGKADALGQVVDETIARTHRFAEEAAPRLVEALLRVRDTASAAADRARETLATVIPEAARRLGDATADAMARAAEDGVVRQLAEIRQASDAAVDASARAGERLSRQVQAIVDHSAIIETRIADARSEREEAERDTFTRRSAMLIEAMNSAAIDIVKAFAPDVSDSAWAAYLKGDRGVFTRRAVRIVDAGHARDIARLYDADLGFRDMVNRYIHDFEAMLRQVLAQRDGSPLGVTLLSSDMGKLYVALAQAIERLR